MTDSCTLVGSREAPKKACRLMKSISGYCHDLGYLIRTGDALGIDKASHDGLIAHLGRLPTPEEIEVWVPWKPKPDHRFENPQVLISPQWFDNYRQAVRMAEYVHPKWENVSRAGRALHGRNPYQILGRDLKTPSKFLVYYAIPQAQGKVSGGTNTAVQVARLHQVPEYNLYYEDICEQWIALMENGETDVVEQATLVPSFLPKKETE